MAITQALLLEPDVLLMDEPTNHLDVEGILWLERLLKNRAKAFFRHQSRPSILEAIATRMVELNRCYPEGALKPKVDTAIFRTTGCRTAGGKPTINPRWPIASGGKWNGCVEGPKPVRPKRGRIQSAGKLIEELDQVESRAAQSSIGIDFSASGRKSKQLLVAKEVTKRFNEKPVVTNLELLLGPVNAWASLARTAAGRPPCFDCWPARWNRTPAR